MSEHAHEDESGTRDLSPEQEAESQVNLEEPDATADVAWSPPDARPISAQFAQDDGVEETIDQRIAQEVPEEGSAYGAPETPAQERSLEPVGGDDPDAIPAEQDVLGGPAEVPTTHPHDGAADPAEEAAIQVREGSWDSDRP